MTRTGPLTLLMLLAVAGLATACRGSGDSPDLSAGKKVDIGGWSLYLQCKGSGSPTVVLDAGLQNSRTTWAGVEPRSAQQTRTCSYDRAGVGKSDLRPSRPTEVRAEQVVDELHTLLDKAKVTPPYVLVGHSMGGLHARLFAARHPDDVSGLVFVDPTSPEYFGPGRSEPEPEQDGAMIAYDTAYDTVRSVRLRDRPAIVLFSSEQLAITEEEAGELARRSSNSLLVRTETGHRIHAERPGLVIEAIDLVVQSARSSAELQPCRQTRIPTLGGRCMQ